MTNLAYLGVNYKKEVSSSDLTVRSSAAVSLLDAEFTYNVIKWEPEVNYSA